MPWIPLAELNADTHPRDAGHWRLEEGAVRHQSRRLRSVNAATFEAYAGEESFLGRDRDRVFHAWSALTKVDRESFVALGDRYFRDKNNAYLEYETSLKPLRGGGLEDFAVLGNGYARNRGHAYYWGAVLKKCESPLTLALAEPISDDAIGFAIDDRNIYCEGAVLKGADRGAWRLLERGFSRDEKSVYFGASKLPRADAATWELLEGSYSRDAERVYCMQFRLPDAVPETWRPLGNSYSTDGERVYHVARVVDGMEIETQP